MCLTRQTRGASALLGVKCLISNALGTSLFHLQRHFSLRAKRPLSCGGGKYYSGDEGGGLVSSCGRCEGGTHREACAGLLRVSGGGMPLWGQMHIHLVF